MPNFLDVSAYADDLFPKFSSNPGLDVWESYNLNEDFNEKVGLADKHPEKLKELKYLYDKEAAKYNIYPLIDFEYVFKRVFEQQAKSKDQSK